MSTESITELTRAQAEYQKALKEAERVQREEDKVALRAATTAGRAAKEEYERLRRIFYEAERVANSLQAELTAANEGITAHERAEPKPLDFPTEEEAAAWARRVNQLIALRNELIEEGRDKSRVREQARRESIAAAHRLQNHQGIVANLSNKISDPENFGRVTPGGVRGV